MRTTLMAELISLNNSFIVFFSGPLLKQQLFFMIHGGNIILSIGKDSRIFII
jgi:hypothetical protein